MRIYGTVAKADDKKNFPILAHIASKHETTGDAYAASSFCNKNKSLSLIGERVETFERKDTTICRQGCPQPNALETNKNAIETRPFVP